MIRPVLPACIALLLAACGANPDTGNDPGGDAALQAQTARGAPMPETPPVPNETAAGQRIEADVRHLADDRLEGRETGTPGYDLAADHVAARFGAIGLQPAGDDGGWFQRVPLVRAVGLRDGATMEVTRNGRTIALRLGDQFLPMPNFNAPESTVSAPAVFVGQAIHAPELQHDDFDGVDLHGRIAIVFGGAPQRFADNPRAHYGSLRTKTEAVVARGAVGMVLVNTVDDEAGTPWARTAAQWDRPAMRLRGADGAPVDAPAQLQAMARVGAAAADLVFADGPHNAAQLFADARAGTLRPFALPGTLTLAARTRIDTLESRNVVARLPGRDPARAGEAVVQTAHLDHIGTGAPVDGDAIYNGALDNALGVAILLEAAQLLATADDAPARSTVFAALTGEEQGLLGAEWLARHPPAGVRRMVANLNIDMPILTAPTRDIVAIGSAHSTLQAAVEQAAAEVGVDVSPDPFPEEVAFVRSDQYAFVRAGIPALYLDAGVTAANPGQEPKIAATWFLRNCYHQPCDQADLPIQYGDAARLAEVSARITRIVGDAADAPRWNAGDFFGERFGGR
ncbi:M28 family metallopeptidase [Luteimonas sp. BDR2-5]|uniref:M28 family metallopeptidase n=1 Tax=Proluteimonas luteida TaxID=2878685 RepID=UPI001E5148DB|nr:M28 family metallopeptidase [Luteimonas sp. BDR2-5]MCD9027753.1 M28 family metallopeptidase [Luteimonas sp. BDR2-5]